MPRLLAAVLLATLALAAPSQALTLSYRDRSSWHAEATAAMALWSSSGANVHFRRARAGERPAVIFSDHRFGRGEGAGEWAAPYVWLMTPGTHEHGDPRQRWQTVVAVHELGHALGLAHRGGCSIMNASSPDEEMFRRCQHGTEQMPCGPQRVDITAVARRYGWAPGGRRRASAAGFGLCDTTMGPAGARPTKSLCFPVQVTSTAPDGTVTTWRLKQAFIDGVAEPGQETCTYSDGTDKVIVAIDAWTPTGRERRGDPVFPSGNCDGSRADGPWRFYSRSRYLTVRVFSGPQSSDDVLDRFDAAGVLPPILQAAEAAKVGLPCGAA